MNFKRKLISCIVMWSVILGSFLSYSPETRVFSATGVPEITMISPVGESVFTSSNVEFTGKISDDISPPDKLLIKVFEHTANSDQPIEITDGGQWTLTPNDQFANFSYSKDFSAGVHNITFIVTDGDGLSSTSAQTFTVQLSEAEQTTEKTVSTNTSKASLTQTSLTIKESQSMEAAPEINSLTAGGIAQRPYMANMFLIPRGAEGEYNPDKVPNSYLPAEDMTRVPLDSQILLEIRSVVPFNPTQPLITFFGDSTGKEKLVKTFALSGGITSYIYIFTPEKENLDPSKAYFVYLNPNELIPRFLKFTTVSNNYEKYQFEADKGNVDRERDYIHGPYSVVTNTCSFCHSTHNATNQILEGGKYGTVSGTNNLCMACHDGTNGSPELDSNYATNKHSQVPDVSCTSCHDPHNPGTKENPNSLHSTYKKASTTTGQVNDYSLCFTCHNDDKNINIQQYYVNDPYVGESGHNITSTIDSGSQLNGQIPCSECHETHGSKNIKMLRTNLGNVKLDDSKQLYESQNNNWDAAEERNFCLKCHNNSTSLYGRTSAFSATKATGEKIPGHQTEDEQSCASCHGGASQSSIEAAHAPKKGIHVLKPTNP
ncbi:cytochrome c3 family protein [Neobacillus niacini]|uniref:cytochrome c3 family protein n=1 Tax=Neobacillus niacini TaxID=86668 RepID=UPI002FFDC014